MIKYFAPLLLLASTSAYAQDTASSATKTSLTIGGMATDHGNASLTFDGEVATQKGRWQGVYDLDASYQQAKNVVTLDMISGEAKQNYALDARDYLIGDVRYDYNEFRPWKNTGVISAGYGYKLVRTGNIKISNELTTGIRITDDGKYAVLRDSVWISYNKGPFTAVNKFLIEKSNINYYRNQSVVSYALTPVLSVGVQNMYTRDVKENNVTSFTLGLKL